MRAGLMEFSKSLAGMSNSLSGCFLYGSIPADQLLVFYIGQHVDSRSLPPEALQRLLVALLIYTVIAVSTTRLCKGPMVVEVGSAFRAASRKGHSSRQSSIIA